MTAENLILEHVKNDRLNRALTLAVSLEKRSLCFDIGALIYSHSDEYKEIKKELIIHLTEE